jgi:hypothetical protein
MGGPAVSGGAPVACLIRFAIRVVGSMTLLEALLTPM